MIDPAGRAFLQDLIRREGRSLLQYVSEAFPWTTFQEQESLARLQAIAKEEEAAIALVARFLSKNHIVPPPLGPYPMNFTTINFVSLDHLLPLLIDFQRRRVKELESVLENLTDAEVRQQVEHFLAMKRRHLESLEEMHKSLGVKPALAG